MATYEKLIYNIPPYQEGNVQDFEFELDAEFPISDINEITMQVRRKYDRSLVFEKKMSVSNQITLNTDTRVVNIPFLPIDTTGKSGQHLYEIDFVNIQGQPFATIGGEFIINEQINLL